MPPAPPVVPSTEYWSTTRPEYTHRCGCGENLRVMGQRDDVKRKNLKRKERYRCRCLRLTFRAEHELHDFSDPNQADVDGAPQQLPLTKTVAHCEHAPQRAGAKVEAELETFDG